VLSAGGIRNRLLEMLILGFLFSHKALFNACGCSQSRNYGLRHRSAGEKLELWPDRNKAPDLWTLFHAPMDAYGFIMFGLRILSAERRKLSLLYAVAAEMLQLSFKDN